MPAVRGLRGRVKVGRLNSRRGGPLGGQGNGKRKLWPEKIIRQPVTHEVRVKAMMKESFQHQGDGWMEGLQLTYNICDMSQSQISQLVLMDDMSNIPATIRVRGRALIIQERVTLAKIIVTKRWKDWSKGWEIGQIRHVIHLMYNF